MQTLILIIHICAVGFGEDTLVNGFETQQELRDWEINAGKPSLVSAGVTQGKSALEIVFDPKAQYQAAYMFWNKVQRDWARYDALVIDVFNPNERPVHGYTLIADQAWKDKGMKYWNRHNSSTSFPPGKSAWTIPVRGLFRGEAGSRNNDIKRNIDPDSIIRLDLGFGRSGSTGRIVIDNIRFVKLGRPTDIWAFDFGPPSQPTMLGWTAVSNESKYTSKQKFGWVGANPWKGAARDTTFGTPLTQDFCEAGGYNFQIDTGPGNFNVTVIYENSGYWGGEQSRHTTRRIFAQGNEVWKETREHGSAHALFRFEDIEPVGIDIWDTYMAGELVKPVNFTTKANDNKLLLRFEADRTWGSKLSGIAVHRADDKKSAKWLSDQMTTVSTEFRRKAANLEPPAQTPEKWREKPLLVWPVNIETTVTPNSLPTALTDNVTVTRTAARGEFEPFCIALRPSKLFPRCSAVLKSFKGPATLNAEVQIVRYNTSRGFGTISYRIQPHTLREAKTFDLTADVTRQLNVTARIPEDAKPGVYKGQLDITSEAGATLATVPLVLNVHSAIVSRKTEYLMGFFGLMPPGLLPADERWQVLEETLVLLKDRGMNAVCGGPSWTLTGWRNGVPQIDYGDVDRFFELLKKHGFDRAINGYGGLRFQELHYRYEKGSVAAKVEKQSGLPYEQAFLKAWEAVDAHARQHQWPTIFYAMCDETRVRDVAERELEFMRLMAKTSAQFPKTVRTSGSYSVHFRNRPKDMNDMLYWHQRYFEDLDISALNGHDQSVMDEATRLQRAVHTYNQGRSRYSFGLYQWSEFRKGVQARWQWHLNVLHGYQFFDLDGREPDTAMICYGKNGIYPTIHFERCREGAEDFYLYQTLWNLVEQRQKDGQSSPAVVAARNLLENQVAAVKINQRQPPEGFNADSFKLKVLNAIDSLK